MDDRTDWPRANPLFRFLRHVRFDDVTGCWEWQGRVDYAGYGVFSYGGERSAHRSAYRLFKGPIPEGLHLDHLCCVTHCVNPDHLEPVTPRENTDRAARRRARGTHPSNATVPVVRHGVHPGVSAIRYYLRTQGRPRGDNGRASEG